MLVLVGLMVLVMVLFVVLRAMLVGVSVAGQSPDQESDAGDNQDPADDVALLGFDLLLELEPDQGDNSTERDGYEHVAGSRQGSHPRQAPQAPALRSGDDGQWHPMVGKNRVDDAHHRRAQDE
jgi:hypothetical protein